MMAVDQVDIQSQRFARESVLRRAGFHMCFSAPVQAQNDQRTAFFAQGCGKCFDEFHIRLLRIGKTDQTDPDPFDLSDQLPVKAGGSAGAYCAEVRDSGIFQRGQCVAVTLGKKIHCVVVGGIDRVNAAR